MESVRSVTRKYLEMVKLAESQEPSYGTVNVYDCSNGHSTTTKDVDKGTTPFVIGCRFCKELAQSRMYRTGQNPEVIHVEFYRPSLKEALKLRKNPNLLEHVLNGGLLKREV